MTRTDARSPAVVCTQIAGEQQPRTLARLAADREKQQADGQRAATAMAWESGAAPTAPEYVLKLAAENATTPGVASSGDSLQAKAEKKQRRVNTQVSKAETQRERLIRTLREKNLHPCDGVDENGAPCCVVYSSGTGLRKHKEGVLAGRYHHRRIGGTSTRDVAVRMASRGVLETGRRPDRSPAAAAQVTLSARPGAARTAAGQTGRFIRPPQAASYMKTPAQIAMLETLFAIGGDPESSQKKLTPEEMHERMKVRTDDQGRRFFSHRRVAGEPQPNGKLLSVSTIRTWYHQAAANKKKNKCQECRQLGRGKCSCGAAAMASASNASSAAASTAGEQTGPPAREVEHILDKRMAVGGGVSYLVQWQGQARTDAEYIPEHQLDDVVDAVVAFNATMSA